MEIRVDHVTRVEGHGNIVASLVNGKVKEAMFQVVEANRFFEGFLRDRSWEEVSHLATRICGICALSHSSASIQATENALGIKISEQTKLLRRLIMDAEMISSHALHVCFLAAPDFLGLPSVIPLISQNPDIVKLAYRLKLTGYDLAEIIVGRHTHPVSVVPGGFTSMPSAKAFEEIRPRVEALRDDLAVVVGLFQTLEIPPFERATEYVSLRQPDHYTFYAGDIVSSEGKSVPASRYLEAAQEFVVPHSTSKHTKWNKDAYMVGALARVNNNWKQLHPAAQKVMDALGLKPPCHNTLMITVAQVVELAHAVEDSLAMIDELLKRGIQEEYPEVKPQAGKGIGVVEAPRGLLIHDYTYDDKGRLLKANCIIPTGQNYGNLDRDMHAMLLQFADQPEDKMRLLLEMLVRAYDPCISCSVH